jgi:DNA-binding response OmpR family regulator
MIKTAIYRLRKHLADAGADPAIVESIRGRGYSLALTPNAPPTAESVTGL